MNVWAIMALVLLGGVASLTGVLLSGNNEPETIFKTVAILLFLAIGFSVAALIARNDEDEDDNE